MMAEDIAVPFNSSWRQKIVAGVCFGTIVLAFFWASYAIAVVGLPFLYLIPLVLGLLGFIYGFDSLLICFLVVFTGGAVLLDTTNLIMAVAGICIPIAMFLGLQDRRIWPEKELKENKSNLQWLILPAVSHERLRNGIILMSTVGFYILLFLGSELAFDEYRASNLQNIVLSDLDFNAIDAGKIQLSQIFVSVVQYMPALTVTILIFWILGSLKLAMVSIRFIRMTPAPNVKIGRGAIPVWYIVLTTLVGIIGTQTSGEIRFICLNISLILALPALIVGLGLISEITSLIKYGWFIRWMIYLVVMLTMGFGSLSIIVILGFLDAPLQIREWLIARLGPKLEKKYA